MSFQILSKEEYKQQYQASITDPELFWSGIANNFFWFEKWREVMNCDLSKAEISWFCGAKTNISYNCLDRHLERHGNKIAIITEGNDPKDENRKITYKELHEETCKFANLLLAQGIKKGDPVCIYMPMIPESVVAMLACARIGAVTCVVFAGFSAKALAGRIQDSGAKMLITADFLFRGEKKIELFEIAKEALQECDSVESVVLYQRNYFSSVERSRNHEKEIKDHVNLRGFNFVQPTKIKIWQEEITKYSSNHKAEICDAEDPLFILYTSGSTGKPKGILHTTAGYMVYAAYSFKNVFQYQENDIFFCTADIGWITGHSYLVYGPLLNAATILMFEGIPTYPTASRFWQVIEKHKVNIFYTAPTAIRALMQKGDEFVLGHDLSSLKTLGTVGEPINEEAWQWYYEKIGNKKCSIVDTWWQTETGGIMISSMAHVFESKPAHAGLPLPGIVPILFDDKGNEVNEKNKIGNLCFKQAWPGMARGVWNDREKFFNTYYKEFRNHYFAGDGAFSDEDGFYRIIGRTDDVIKVSGHRLGTAEIENAINSHAKVAESAVIGIPHEIKGEAICAFVIMKTSRHFEPFSCHPERSEGSQKAARDFSPRICKTNSKAQDDNGIKEEIIALIQKEIGAIAKPDKIYLVSDLPKTRSGKIMRRILKKILAGEEELGDISTLVNPDITKEIKEVIKCN
ncbi:MAG: acetate--CoA ligase [Rickettsiales bacterium]|nr:acetate--CoA ligase [Rickettsiales bacterium]